MLNRQERRPLRQRVGELLYAKVWPGRGLILGLMMALRHDLLSFRDRVHPDDCGLRQWRYGPV